MEINDYDEILVTRLLDQVRVKDTSLDVKLKTGQSISIEK